METEKVLVAMSGGVDSSVAAKLLTDAGFSCIGCTMKLYDNEDAGIPKANTSVSYTHLDVYKRQASSPAIDPLRSKIKTSSVIIKTLLCLITLSL